MTSGHRRTRHKAERIEAECFRPGRHPQDPALFILQVLDQQTPALRYAWDLFPGHHRHFGRHWSKLAEDKAWVWDQVKALREHLECNKACRKDLERKRALQEHSALERARREDPEREKTLRERQKREMVRREDKEREDDAALREFRRVKRDVRRPPKSGPLPMSARKVRVYVVVQVLCQDYGYLLDFAIETLVAVLAEPWRDVNDPESKDNLSKSTVEWMYYEGRKIVGLLEKGLQETSSPAEGQSGKARMQSRRLGGTRQLT